jgi:hypothetical protein
MKTYLIGSFAALALIGALQAQAQDGMVSIADAAATHAIGATVAPSYGTGSYRAQYQIRDLLAAVTEDVTAELSAFLGLALEKEEGDETRSDRRDARKVASAY